MALPDCFAADAVFGLGMRKVVTELESRSRTLMMTAGWVEEEACGWRGCALVGWHRPWCRSRW